MRLIIIISILTAGLFSLYGASFEDIGSVRARGMGDAFESVSAGIDSVHYNPAGTAYLSSFQVFVEAGLPALGFDDESFLMDMHSGFALPFSREPYLLPLTYLFKGLTLGNEDVVIQDATFSFAFHRFSVSDFAYENLFTINMAKSFNNLFEGANLAAGVNFNIFNHGFEMTEDLALHPDAPLDSATGYGLDVGLTYDFSKYIRLSFVMANLIEPNISFFSDGAEYVNQQIKGGLAWQLGDISFMKNFLASIGLVQISRDAEDIRRPETIYKAGIEFWQWQNRLGFRFGYKTELNMFCSGISFKQRIKQMNHLIVHYAFNYPLDTKNMKNYLCLSWETDFADYHFDYRKDSDIQEQNRITRENYDKGLVIVKYKTQPNDNLFNISLIHYGSPGQVDLLKKHNQLESDTDLPKIIEVPYQAKQFELYEVQAGDTLDTIADKYYGDFEKADMIRKFNEIPFSKLRIGRILVIPTTIKKVEKKEVPVKKPVKPDKTQTDKSVQPKPK